MRYSDVPMLSRNDTITLGQQVVPSSIQPLRYCYLYNGPQILDTELRQTKNLNLLSNMGKTSRKKYTPEVKAQVAIEALKEQSTLAKLAANLSAG